jgi:hypothetical protein
MLSKNEAECLTAWSNTVEEWDVLSFKLIGEQCTLDKTLIRRTVRALARKGYTVFVRGCMNDEGMVCGSGYALTAKGRQHVTG